MASFAVPEPEPMAEAPAHISLQFILLFLGNLGLLGWPLLHIRTLGNYPLVGLVILLSLLWAVAIIRHDHYQATDSTCCVIGKILLLGAAIWIYLRLNV